MPPTLNPGDVGPAVSEAQYLLARYIQEPTAIDGVFGPTTEAAVQDYQQKFGLTVTGVVDPPTWTSLLTVLPIPAALELGSHGPAVRRLQRAFNELTYGPPFHFLREDGYFGHRTEDVVKQFQTQHGLPVDGVVGLPTWAASLGLANVRLATIAGL